MTTQYRPKQKPKHAVLKFEPGEYKLSWGEQKFSGLHVFINGEYGCDTVEFFKTHVAIAPDQYVKNTLVTAEQLKEETNIKTVLNGKEEAYNLAPAGSWVVTNPSGEQYAMSNEKFHQLYEPA